MNVGRTIFSQLIAFLPDREFRRCVDRYDGDRRLRGFSCWDQFLCMAFAQLTFRESLRDIEACLRSSPERLYHMGLRGRVSRSTLADANENHGWRIFADFAQLLMDRAPLLYAGDPFGVELQQSVYALDATTIDLCLSMFPWARFLQRKGAAKMHTLLDLHGNIPAFVCITDGKVHEVNILDQLIPEAGAFYIMDRGYLDFKRLYRLTLAAASFVIRPKKNVRLRRRSSAPTDPATGVKSDQVVVLKNIPSLRNYPVRLRRVRFVDTETQRSLVFLTNNFDLPALTIAMLYKSRWQVELFFKWMKQHLRIKAFFGTSQNAVRTQIWIALTVYVLVAIVKKDTNLSVSLYQILQVASVTLFERIPLLQAFQHEAYPQSSYLSSNQLPLFDL